jgi:hypothetical protein
MACARFWAVGPYNQHLPAMTAVRSGVCCGAAGLAEVPDGEWGARRPQLGRNAANELKCGQGLHAEQKAASKSRLVSLMWHTTAACCACCGGTGVQREGQRDADNRLPGCI